MVDYETQVESSDPTVLLRFPLEPLVQFRKLAVVEIAPRDANTVDVAAGLIEGVIGQRAPQVKAHEIPAEYQGKFSGHRMKKVREILGDIRCLGELQH
jgi:hypothetical protein